MKDINPHIQEDLWTPNRTKTKTIPRHIIVKLLKTYGKDKYILHIVLGFS